MYLLFSKKARKTNLKNMLANINIEDILAIVIILYMFMMLIELIIITIKEKRNK